VGSAEASAEASFDTSIDFSSDISLISEDSPFSFEANDSSSSDVHPTKESINAKINNKHLILFIRNHLIDFVFFINIGQKLKHRFSRYDTDKNTSVVNHGYKILFGYAVEELIDGTGNVNGGVPALADYVLYAYLFMLAHIASAVLKPASKQVTLGNRSDVNSVGGNYRNRAVFVKGHFFESVAYRRQRIEICDVALGSQKSHYIHIFTPTFKV
jgi:hypothetical protein